MNRAQIKKTFVTLQRPPQNKDTALASDRPNYISYLYPTIERDNSRKHKKNRNQICTRPSTTKSPPAEHLARRPARLIHTAKVQCGVSHLDISTPPARSLPPSPPPLYFGRIECSLSKAEGLPCRSLQQPGENRDRRTNKRRTVG